MSKTATETATNHHLYGPFHTLAISRNDRYKIKKSFTFLSQHYRECNPKIFNYLKNVENFFMSYQRSLEYFGLNENIYYDMFLEIRNNAIELNLRSKEKGLNSLSKDEKKFLKRAEQRLELSIDQSPNLECLCSNLNFFSKKLPEDTSFKSFLRSFPKQYSPETD